MEMVLAFGFGVLFALLIQRRSISRAEHRHEQTMAILNRKPGTWESGPLDGLNAEGMRNRMAGRPENPKPDRPR